VRAAHFTTTSYLKIGILYSDASGMAAGGVLKIGVVIVEDICKMLKSRKSPQSCPPRGRSLSHKRPAPTLEPSLYNVDIEEVNGAQVALKLIERYRKAEAEFWDRHNLGSVGRRKLIFFR